MKPPNLFVPLSLICLALVLMACDTTTPDPGLDPVSEDRILVSHSQPNQTCIEQAWGGKEILIAIDTLYKAPVDISITSLSSNTTVSWSSNHVILNDHKCRVAAAIETSATTENLSATTGPPHYERRPEFEEGKLYQITILEKTFTYTNCSSNPSACPDFVIPGGDDGLQDFAFIINAAGELNSIPFANSADADQIHLPYNEGIEKHWTHGTNTWQIPGNVHSICQDLSASTVQHAHDCEKEMRLLTYFLAPGALTSIPTQIEIPAPTWLGTYPVGVHEFSASLSTTADEFCTTSNMDSELSYTSTAVPERHVRWENNQWESNNDDWSVGDITQVRHFDSITCSAS